VAESILLMVFLFRINFSNRIEYRFFNCL